MFLVLLLATALGARAWAQCEDHFFQLEDTYHPGDRPLRRGGRRGGVRSDTEVAAFEVVESSKRDFGELPAHTREIATAFAAGDDFYLERGFHRGL